MVSLFISCEGQTEEMFVKRILADHLLSYGVYVTPVVLHTSRSSTGVVKKGGGNSYAKVRDAVLNLCRNSHAFVTTMYDYYKFPSINGKSDWQSADELEQRLSEDINRSNFHPNILQYEFEGLLFSDIRAFSVCNIPEKSISALELECAGVSPEDIDGGENTAPSKRICRQYPEYQKVLDGIAVAETIGLKRIRACCPRFDAWISWMESIGEI